MCQNLKSNFFTVKKFLNIYSLLVLTYLYIKIADNILCPSFNTKKDLMELYNIDEKKISVTYFGIENLNLELAQKNNLIEQLKSLLMN